MILVTLLMIAAVIFFVGIIRKQDAKKAVSVSEFSEVSPYDVTDEKAAAMQKLEKGVAPSDIITDDDTTDRYIGLAFSGLSDSVTNQKILQLLDEYNRKATFFIPAIGAVECEEDIVDMIHQGHAIGSNTLNSTVHMEEMSVDELVNDFCASNKVIKALSDEDKPLLQCNATVYTEELLQVANACGNPQAVYSTHFVNYQSFTSYIQVLSYINKLPKGTILTIKIHGVLDEIEMEDKEVDEDPAKDKQATIDPDQQAFLELPEDERLPQIVEWILLALEETNYQTKQIKDFGVDNTVDTSLLYDEEYVQQQDAQQIYSYFPMSSPYVGLQLRGISDEEKLTHVLDSLKEHEATATFYVTAKEVKEYPQNIQKIIDAGYAIANGGVDNELLTGHTEQEVRAAIQKCNEELTANYQLENLYFMPPEGKCDSIVQAAAAKEQMTILTYNRCPIVHGGKLIETTMKNFTDSLSKGSLIYVDLESYEKSDEIIEQILSSVDEKKYQTASLNTLFLNKTSESEMLMASVQIPDVLSTDEIAKLRKENGGEEAFITKQVYTTERALAFAFSGITEQKALDSVLASMNQMGAQGTFFVTYAEMKLYADRVKKIVESGNEIGIALIPGDNTTFISCCNEIAAAQEYMEKNYKLTPKLIMNTISRTENDKVLSEMKEAVREMNCRMIGPSVSVVQSSLKGISSAGSYYANLSKSNFEIQMGQIVYTRLDYLSSSSILGA